MPLNVVIENPASSTSAPSGDTGSASTSAASDEAEAKRAAGIGRIGALMAKIQAQAQTCYDLVSRWHLDSKDDDTVRPDLLKLAECAADVLGGSRKSQELVAQLEALNWQPPVAKAKMVEGAAVAVKDDFVTVYATIPAKTRLKVTGEGPVRGTVWVEPQDGGGAKVMVAKVHLRKV